MGYGIVSEGQKCREYVSGEQRERVLIEWV